MTVVAPTGTDLAQFLTILPLMAGQINADVAEARAQAQAAPRLAAGTNLDDLDTPRTDWVTATIDSIGNVPPGEVAGFVRTFWQSTTNRVQVWYTSGLSGTMWVRFRGSSGWTAWKRFDAQWAIDQAAAYTDAAVAGMGSASASGYKTVPVALTVGGSSATFGTTSGGIRIPMDFAPTITRWRVHARNINPRFGLNNAGSISLTGMWFGAHNGSGNFTGTPTQIVGAVSTPSDGSEYVSPWVNTPLTGGSSYLLAYGFSAGAATQAVVGGGWSVASSSDAINNAATKTALTTMPLDVWLEVEVPSGVPVVAGVGDSLMSGVGATQPVHDSTVSQYARANGALPMHYSASGEAASASTDPTAYKWSRWKAFSRPDAALVGMGSNDLFGGDSLGTVQTNYQALLSLVSTGLTKNIYAATIMPRDAVTGTMETTRRSFNTWLRGLGPSQVRDVFDFVPGVSSDDETLTPALTADGIHLTTAGYAANRDAITRVIAPPQASGPAGPAGTVTDSSVAALVPGATSTGTALDIRGDARWARTTRLPINVLNYAVGDGVTDDTTNLNNALAAAAGGKLIFPRGGTFKCTNTLTVPSGITIEGNGATLDFSSLAAGAALGQQFGMTSTGTIGADLPIGVAISQWSHTVTGISSTSTLAAGDLVLIENDERPVVGMSRTDRDKGELNIIQSVDSSTQVTLTTGALYAYGTTSLKMRKITPVTGVDIGGLNIKMGGVASAHNAIRVRYGRNINIHDNTIDGAEDIAISLSTVYNGKAAHNTVRNSTSSTTLGLTGYGIAPLEGSRHIVVESNNFYNCRHFVAGGGQWPVVYVEVTGNQGERAVDAGYDCHEPCLHWEFSSNTAVGVPVGFIIRGQSITLRDNNVVDATSFPYKVQTFDGVTEQRDIRLIDNRATHCAFGLTVDGQAAGAEPNCLKYDIEISGNDLRDCGTVPILLRHFNGASVKGNTVVGSSSHAIQVLGLSGTQSTFLDMAGNDVRAAGADGIRVQFVDDVQITGGQVSGAVTQGIELQTCNRTNTSGVVVRAPGQNGIFINAGAVHVIDGCTVTGGTGGTSYDAVRVTATSDLMVTGGYLASSRYAINASTTDYVSILGVNGRGATQAARFLTDATNKVVTNNLI